MSVTAARTGAALLAGTAAVAGILSGCTNTSLAASRVNAAGPGITTSSVPALRSGPGTSASGSGKEAGGAASSCPDLVFSRMTPAQRAGQLFLVGMSDDSAGPATAAAEEKYHFGSVLFAGNTSEGTKGVAATTAYVQSLATPAITGGVRFFVAANQEGGQVQNLRGAGFATMPSALTQGSWSDSYLRQQARTWGQELKSAGVNLDLAPVMDVVPASTASSNAPIGQLDREFGHSAAVTGPHGAAFIQGMTSAGVATSAKHFPGLGRVAGNTDFTANVVDSATSASDPDLATYRSAVSAGAPFMMVALATYTKIDPAQLAVFSPTVMKLIRGSMAFGGVIISDDLGDATAVASISPAQRAISFLNAGGDMITSQSFGPAEEMEPAVLAKVSSDPAFAAKVGNAVKLILAAKQKFGLLSC